MPPTRRTGLIRRTTRWPTATAPSPTRSASSACSAGCPPGPPPAHSPRPLLPPPRWRHWGRAISTHRGSPSGGRRTRRPRRAAKALRQSGREGDWRKPAVAARRGARRPGLDGGHLTDRPDPLHALLAAIGRCGSPGPAHSVFLPVWAAYPAVGFSGRDALPGLRSDAADRVAGRGRPVTWPLAFLHLVAESARMALRELDRLEAAAEQGRGVVAGGDKRSRLPDALDALLRVPALTPKALAARLKVAPQTGTALLRELQGRGWSGR